MTIDRVIIIAFSPATLAFIAFFFAVFIDFWTWRRIGDAARGSLVQFAAGLNTCALVILGLAGALLTSFQLAKPNVPPLPPAIPFVIVFILCNKITLLAMVLAPRRRDLRGGRHASSQLPDPASLVTKS